jgi:hypothetical protein
LQFFILNDDDDCRKFFAEIAALAKARAANRCGYPSTEEISQAKTPAEAVPDDPDPAVGTITPERQANEGQRE